MKISRLSFTIFLVGLIILLVTTCSIFLVVEAEINENFGFSTELIHRDSPLSPFSNHNLSNVESQGITFRRIPKKYQTQQIGSSVLIMDDYSYLMKISYGKPPVEFYQIIDTGSDLSWIQCEPCVHCFPSNHSSPYPPKISRTFVYEKCPQNKKCPYNMTYGDKSYSLGELARETITIGSGAHKVQFSNFLFGCGHNNVGHFAPKGAGIVGFNLGERSFITQLRSLHHGKFAYCMAPPTSAHPGKISFGNEAVVRGHGVMQTPLIIESSLYNVMLEAITVASKKLKYFPDHSKEYNYLNNSLSSNDSVINGGKIVVDSGTNMIILPFPLQSNVAGVVREHIKSKPISKRPPAPFTLCYPASLKDDEIPNIVVHFPGVDLVLSPLHTFMRTQSGDRCLAIIPANRAILGNMAQVNFLVGYDLVEKKIAFKPTDCSSLRL